MANLLYHIVFIKRLNWHFFNYTSVPVYYHVSVIQLRGDMIQLCKYVNNKYDTNFVLQL